MHYTNLTPQRQEQLFIWLDQVDRKLHRAPAIGPVDMRTSLEKVVSAIIRSGNCLFIDETRVRCAPVRSEAA